MEMQKQKEKQAILLLEDGSCFKGKAAGASGKAFGIVVFNTGMVGYQQLLTSSASSELLIIQTFPLIGNYGVNKDDYASDKAYATGLIAREFCDNPSNYKCTGDIKSFMESQNVVGISGLDTRHLTKHIRENGEMRGVICSDETDEKILLASLLEWKPSPYEKAEQAKLGTASKCKLFMLDLGASNADINVLVENGAEVLKASCNIGIEQVKAYNPNGIVISTGGGNPADYGEEIDFIKELIKLDIPVLAIGLGHLLLAKANGMSIERLKHGHRGANQPVYFKDNGRTYITSQNHGYAVDGKSITNGEINYFNANDKTVEGICYKNGQGVQFVPDVTQGKQSTIFVYDKFFKVVLNMKGGVN